MEIRKDLEIWVDIAGYDGWYQISDQARVRSYKTMGPGNKKAKSPKILTINPHRTLNGYLQFIVSLGGNKHRFQLSRLMYETFIGVIPEGLHIDHIDRDTSNNKLNNLRLATRQQNMCNRPADKGSASKYKGVSTHTARNGKKSWRALLEIEGKRISLGLHDTEEEAALAYDRAAAVHFKDFAYLNFPDDIITHGEVN